MFRVAFLLRVIAIILPISTCFYGTASNANTIGKCRFSTVYNKFSGTATEQAKCLLRNVKIFGRIDEKPAVLPQNLANLIGNPVKISRDALERFISQKGLKQSDLGGSLDQPLSRGNTNDPAFPMARYFVIHDTSTPNLLDRPFPKDIDNDKKINSLEGYKHPTKAKAHIFVNRSGQIYVGQKFDVPWRATKIELAPDGIGVSSRGMFIHIENVQPRRSSTAGGAGNDAIAPENGLSDIQYERLALLYAVASFRGGQWLIPAFHATLDEGFTDAHDDPQNFKLEKFDNELSKIIAFR